MTFCNVQTWSDNLLLDYVTLFVFSDLIFRSYQSWITTVTFL